MNTDCNWYVLYTRPKWEKKVADGLTRLALEAYCPLNNVQRQWHDRKKWVQVPLFPSYVFVKATARQHSYIREVPGVINFVNWMAKPAVVKQAEIEAIRDFLAAYQNVQLEKVHIRPADVVQITEGPLMDREGQVIQVSAHTVKVMISSLGYALVAEVARTNVRIIGGFSEPAVIKR